MNDNNQNGGVNRRDFLRGGSLATIMTMLGGVELLAQSTNTPTNSIPSNVKVNVAVIGLGTWGREILKTLGSLPQAQVTIICDTYAAAMRKCASDAPGAKQVADYKAVLEDKSVQAVFIATPPAQHRDIAVEAL